MATRRVSEEVTLYLAYASGYQEYPNSKSDLPWADHGGTVDLTGKLNQIGRNSVFGTTTTARMTKQCGSNYPIRTCGAMLDGTGETFHQNGGNTLTRLR